MPNPMQILETVIREVEAGRRAALCVIVATRGSTPQGAGVMVCVDGRGSMIGTLGGGCVEADVLGRARKALAASESQLLSFELDFEFGLDEGMICGGQMDVAVDVVADGCQTKRLSAAVEDIRNGRAASVPVCVSTPQGDVEFRVRVEERPQLIIVGGGHIGRLLAETMLPLDFDVSVLDDREKFANRNRLRPPIKPVVGHIADTLSAWPIDASTYIVIVTRGHRHDQRALAAVLNSPAKYIGMIGSRRKIEVVFKDLRSDGATKEQLERVYAPVGLEINAVTTEEIAVSIAAQLVAVRRTGGRPIVEGPFPMSDSDG